MFSAGIGYSFRVGGWVRESKLHVTLGGGGVYKFSVSYNDYSAYIVSISI